MSLCETVTLTFQEYAECSKFPSNYFILNASGYYVFFKTTSRKKAQETMENEYGKHYKLRSVGGVSGDGTGCSATCGTRKGQAKYLNKNFGIPGGL